MHWSQLNVGWENADIAGFCVNDENGDAADF